MMEIVQRMKMERKALLQKKAELERQLQAAPEGRIVCYRNGRYLKFYQCLRDDGREERHYLDKSKADLIHELVQKAYCQYELCDIDHDLKAINQYLKYWNEGSRLLDHLAAEPWLEQVEPYVTRKAKVEQWEQEAYPHSDRHPENLKIRAATGIRVRSKSEAIIASELHGRQIPFRYECRLILGSVEIYPDFTILDPKSGDALIWEHFGMMDDESYAANMVSKLRLYIRNGYIPGVNLITSYETKDHPLEIGHIRALIGYYFD